MSGRPGVLLLAGDSHLARLDDEHRALLRRSCDGARLVDRSVGGATSVDLLHRQRLHQVHATWVIISIGTNDAAPQRGTTIVPFRHNLAGVLTNLQSSRLYCLGAPPVMEARLTETPAHSNADHRRYADVTATLCAAHGAVFIDAFAVLAPLMSAGVDVHDPDGLHLGEAGYGALLPAVAAALEVERAG